MRATRSPRVGSCLAQYFEAFAAFKRASGIAFDSSVSALEIFDRFLCGTANTPCQIDGDVLTRFVRSLTRLAPRTRGNVVSIVWQALGYAIRHGAPCPALPERPSFRRLHVIEPYAYSHQEIRKILLALLELRHQDPLRPHMLATLIALLVTTGLRINEALALNLSDVDLVHGVLRIRRGKYGKARDLPILPSTVDGLRSYLKRRERAGLPRGAEAPLFVSLRRDRCGRAVVNPFKDIVKALGIRTPSGAVPRLHDLRHTYAVQRVAQWYREGVDVNTRLAALSGYLGHTSPQHTAHYLRANESILLEAGLRFEALSAPFDLKEGAER
jgi:integrase